MQIIEKRAPVVERSLYRIDRFISGSGKGPRRLRPNCEEEAIQFRRPVGQQYGRAAGRIRVRPRFMAFVWDVSVARLVAGGGY